MLIVLGGKEYGDQAARAGRGDRPQFFVGRRRHAAVGAQKIDGAGKIGRGVGQGAVQIEQDGARTDEWFFRIGAAHQAGLLHAAI